MIQNDYMPRCEKNQWKYQELQHLCKNQCIRENLRNFSFYYIYVPKKSKISAKFENTGLTTQHIPGTISSFEAKTAQSR